MEEETIEFIDYNRWLKRIETDVVINLVGIARVDLFNKPSSEIRNENMEDETIEFIDYNRWLKRIETDVVINLVGIARVDLFNKPSSEICNEFKEIAARWFEIDDDYDLLIDLIRDDEEKKYLFVFKDSISVIIMCLFCIKINMIGFEEEDKATKRLRVSDVTSFGKTCKKLKSNGVILTNQFCKNPTKKKAKELKILLADPQRAKVKIDDFVEDLKTRVEGNESKSETSGEEANDHV
ncbi:25387_t:CDS:2 [Dentiscutata erythropus]|uniref:25387_t:CDS:1 n=1 Tax=Dentiscutata erythropus TaxID=1348616 RepID=A0A9N9HUS0_9GLOM|nr:25387_t:CDS:2 [Dentiscutata erythropus]